MKGLLAAPAVQAVLGGLIGAYMLFAAATIRWRNVDRGVAEAVWARGGPAVICFWHGRILLAHRGWAIGRGAQDPLMLVSQSREGDVIARAARMVGAPAVRGSSAKGAKQKGALLALRALLRHLALGGAAAITPDGPRGPRMRAQMGAIQLAKSARAPIVCLAWSTHRRSVLGAWDRMVLAAPFSRGVFVWGGPIEVPHDAGEAEMEAARRALELELNRITAEADRLAGVDVIEPAPAPHAPSPAQTP